MTATCINGDGRPVAWGQRCLPCATRGLTIARPTCPEAVLDAYRAHYPRDPEGLEPIWLGEAIVAAAAPDCGTDMALVLYNDARAQAKTEKAHKERTR